MVLSQQVDDRDEVDEANTMKCSSGLDVVVWKGRCGSCKFCRWKEEERQGLSFRCEQTCKLRVRWRLGVSRNNKKIGENSRGLWSVGGGKWWWVRRNGPDWGQDRSLGVLLSSPGYRSGSGPIYLVGFSVLVSEVRSLSCSLIYSLYYQQLIFWNLVLLLLCWEHFTRFPVPTCRGHWAYTRLGTT